MNSHNASLESLEIWFCKTLAMVGLSLIVGTASGQFVNESQIPTPLGLQSFSDDSIKIREKDPTPIYFRSNSKGWEAISESDKALEKEDFKMVLYNLMQAQARFEADDDLNGLTIMHFKTGALYQRWEVYERAVEQYSRAFDLCSLISIPTSFKQAILLRLAACSQQLNKADDAISWYIELYNLYQDENNLHGIKYSLTHIADLLIQKSDYEAALKKYYEMADVEERLGLVGLS